jgi:hypothetical protein
MKTAKEILEMTRKESKLAKACDKFIERHASYVESIAMEGHRSARVNLKEIDNETRYCFSYDEIEEMLSYKLEQLGYTTIYNEYNKTVDIQW